MASRVLQAWKRPLLVPRYDPLDKDTLFLFGGKNSEQSVSIFNNEIGGTPFEDEEEEVKAVEVERETTTCNRELSADAASTLPAAVVQFDALADIFGHPSAVSVAADGAKRRNGMVVITKEGFKDGRNSNYILCEGHLSATIDEATWAESLFGTVGENEFRTEKLGTGLEPQRKNHKFSAAVVHGALHIPSRVEGIAMLMDPFRIDKETNPTLNGFYQRRLALAADYKVKHKGASRAFKRRKG